MPSELHQTLSITISPRIFQAIGEARNEDDRRSGAAAIRVSNDRERTAEAANVAGGQIVLPDGTILPLKRIPTKVPDPQAPTRVNRKGAMDRGAAWRAGGMELENGLDAGDWA
jgi:hypothetical protein